jgi:hypothetical protein
MHHQRRDRGTGYERFVEVHHVEGLVVRSARIVRSTADGSGASGAIEPFATVGRLSPSGVTKPSGGGPSHGPEHPGLDASTAELARHAERLRLDAHRGPTGCRGTPDPMRNVTLRTVPVAGRRPADSTAVARSWTPPGANRCAITAASSGVDSRCPDRAGSRSTESSELLGALDALGGRHDRRGWSASCRIARARVLPLAPRPSSATEGGIDLDHVDRVPLEIADRAVAGTEVVEGHAEAVLTQLGHGLHVARFTSSIRSVSVTSSTSAPGSTPRDPTASSRCRSGRAGAFGGRQVDADEQVGRRRHPPSGRAPPQHPPTDRHDQPRALGDRDELVRLDLAVVGVVPPHQCLGTAHLAAVEVDVREVDDAELVPLDGGRSSLRYVR